MKNKLAIFEDYKIRRIYDEETETWYFSVVDIIRALLQQQARFSHGNHIHRSIFQETSTGFGMALLLHRIFMDFVLRWISSLKLKLYS